MNWKNFKEMLPFTSVFLILLGFSKLYVYYNHFDIPIKYFLSPSEIIFGILDNLIFVVLMMFGNIMSVYENMVNKPTVQSARSEKNTKIVLAIIVAILVVGLWVTYLINKDFKTKFYAVLLSVMIGSMMFLNYIVTDYRKKTEKKVSAASIHIVYFSILSFVFLQFLNLNEIKETEKLKYFGTQIITSDSTYLSDSLHSYIGRTNEYTFIYNFDKKYSEILPNSEIKILRLKTNENRIDKK